MTTNSNSSSGSRSGSIHQMPLRTWKVNEKLRVCACTESLLANETKTKTNARHFLTFICFCSRTLSRRLGRSHARLLHLDQQINTSTNKIPVGQFLHWNFLLRKTIYIVLLPFGRWLARAFDTEIENKCKINKQKTTTTVRIWASFSM